MCNCALSSVEGYGKYDWTKGLAARLRDNPKFSNDLCDMICSRPPTPPTTTRDIAQRVPAALVATTPTTSTTSELRDIKALCGCLSSSQQDNYATWIHVAMNLKKLGALWASGRT